MASPIVFNIVLGLIGAVWAGIKGTEQWKAYTKGKLDAGVESIFVGVQKTYDESVREAKAALPPGEKLSIEAKKAYQKQALDNAVTEAKAKGVELFKVMTEDQAKLWVERAVSSLKAARG